MDELTREELLKIAISNEKPRSRFCKISPEATTTHIRSGGKVHLILALFSDRNGKIVKTDITRKEIPNQDYTSAHVAQALTYGFIIQFHADKRVYCKITPTGIKAFYVLEEADPNPFKWNDDGTPAEREFTVRETRYFPTLLSNNKRTVEMNYKSLNSYKGFKMVEVPVKIDMDWWKHFYKHSW